MSFQASLEIDSKTFTLLYYRSEFQQQADNKGRPGADIRGGNIWFVVDGSEDDTFSAWMSDATANKDGTINLYSYEQENQVFKKIEFSGAFITHFYESYAMEKDAGIEDKTFITSVGGETKFLEHQLTKIQNSTRKNHLIAGVITAEKICIDGVNHLNNWWA